MDLHNHVDHLLVNVTDELQITNIIVINVSRNLIKILMNF